MIHIPRIINELSASSADAVLERLYPDSYRDTSEGRWKRTENERKCCICASPSCATGSKKCTPLKAPFASGDFRGAGSLSYSPRRPLRGVSFLTLLLILIHILKLGFHNLLFRPLCTCLRTLRTGSRGTRARLCTGALIKVLCQFVGFGRKIFYR
jgi:hypothetical protein